MGVFYLLMSRNKTRTEDMLLFGLSVFKIFKYLHSFTPYFLQLSSSNSNPILFKNYKKKFGFGSLALSQ